MNYLKILQWLISDIGYLLALILPVYLQSEPLISPSEDCVRNKYKFTAEFTSKLLQPKFSPLAFLHRFKQYRQLRQEISNPLLWAHPDCQSIKFLILPDKTKAFWKNITDNKIPKKGFLVSCTAIYWMTTLNCEVILCYTSSSILKIYVMHSYLIVPFCLPSWPVNSWQQETPCKQNVQALCEHSYQKWLEILDVQV